ncbi:hypothetical protein FACS189431_2170 [Alphaproteobacteria bacterium]|nr:hypothetical protein FACS189431_2170 [Alphaproteobacteria bacterium]
MATNTDTTLQPTKIPNTTWLEDAVLGVVFDAFKLDIDDGNYKTLYDKIISLPDLLSNISNHWLADDAKKWHLRLSKDVLDKLNGGESTLDGVQEPYSIAVVEILASLPLSIELGFVKAIMDLDVNRLRKQLNNTDWSSDSSPYGCILPQSTVKILEQMHSGVAFEKQAHSINKTPNWYITELALHDLELALYDQWQSIMKLLETWYIEAGKILSDAKKYKQSATVYSRAIEQAWKLDSHIEQLKVLSEALRDNGKLNFLKNAEWDWDKEHERVGKFRDLAIKGQAELIPHLWNTEQPSSDLPDFFGGAVHRTGEACYDVLASGDTDGFSVLFRPYFLGILGIFDSVRPQVLGWETSSAITWMSEPMLDLFDVSGYAYIYAEYYNKPDVWNECKKIWDACLSKMPLQLQSLAVISNYHQTPRGVITPRAMLRSRWQQELAHTLNKLPRQGVADFYSQPEVQHDSKLIRNIAPWKDDMPFMHVDAIDVFTVKYLLTIPTDDKLDFGIRQDKITNINGSEGGDDA